MWQFFSKECIKCEVNSNTDREARISAGPKRLCTVTQLGAEYFTPFTLPTGQPGWASEDNWRTLGLTDEAQGGQETWAKRRDQRLPALTSRGSPKREGFPSYQEGLGSPAQYKQPTSLVCNVHFSGSHVKKVKRNR